jgi:hypothetical protein
MVLVLGKVRALSQPLTHHDTQTPKRPNADVNMVPGAVVDLFINKATPTRAVKALSFSEEEGTSIKAS